MRFLYSAFMMVITLGVFSGCMHKPAPNLPSHWEGQPVPMASLADKETDKMYVFIMYDKTMCVHTVLRIHSPQYGTVFWDPAGAYGKPEYPVVAKRRNDLVVDPIPSIPDYLSFRQYLPTSKVEIFEFDIKPSQSKYLINLLSPMAGETRAPYKTKTAPMYCASSISKFLSTHAKDIVQVRKTFFPHNLSAALYEANPTRIVLWDYDSILQYEVQ
ncbi:MAG: hypothetical protein O7C75_04770 [Verrucomicrobia bacterium]|nr:hypothetical protein [Verrucomicrobiota bacterium]